MQTRRRVIGMMVSLSILLMTAPALARGATVTGGDFETFADGAALGYAIEGKARMVRTAAGTTIVLVNVTGLSPGATYGSHVHDKACGDNNAGGHYRFAESVPGGALDGHEIWPGPFTANSAGNAVGTEWVGATAGESAQSVVIHAPSGQKIACADLS